MKKKRYTEEQIVRILNEVREGKSIAETSRQYGVSENAIYIWRKKYGNMDIARSVKETVPGVKVVVGGAHVTALPLRTMRDCGEFDFAVLGEGEETILELVGALENDTPGLQDFICGRRNGGNSSK